MLAALIIPSITSTDDAEDNEPILHIILPHDKDDTERNALRAKISAARNLDRNSRLVTLCGIKSPVTATEIVQAGFAAFGRWKSEVVLGCPNCLLAISIEGVKPGILHAFHEFRSPKCSFFNARDASGMLKT